MELPDFMSYANRFSANDFVDKISRIAKRAGAKLVYAAFILYYTLQSDKVSKADKAIIIGALGYMISPLDVIPDAIPIAGLTDDLAVLVYVLKKVWGDVDPEIKEKAKSKLAKWFDEDEIAEIARLAGWRVEREGILSSQQLQDGMWEKENACELCPRMIERAQCMPDKLRRMLRAGICELEKMSAQAPLNVYWLSAC